MRFPKLMTTIGLVAIALVAMAVMPSEPAQAQVGDNLPCINLLPDSQFIELQEALGVDADGILGPQTCGAVLELHDQLIESGEISRFERGFIGRKTYRAATSGETNNESGFVADDDTSCQVTPGYERLVGQLQVALGVSSDGIFGPQTCSALRARQQQWVDDGLMGARSLGWFGPLTTRQLDLALEDAVTDENIIDGCPVVRDTTKRVICVDRSAGRGAVFATNNGRVGELLYGPFNITASLTDSDGPNNDNGGLNDSITVTGSWMVYGCQRVTSTGLEYFCGFYGNQGIHFYPYVGPNYDSHGCVRAEYSTAIWLWENIYRNGLVDAYVVEINIS